ncbi:MAG TPA: AAA family ATPase, partial [Thermoleophilia bacterium]|nr:AAA family ATPase [Thermoleophilia bacterium]
RVLPATLDTSRGLAAALAVARSRAQALAERLQTQAEEAGGLPGREGSRRLAEREVELRQEAEALGERRAAAEVELTHLETRRAELAERLGAIAERFERASFAPPADDDEARALRARAERLVRRRDGLGPVNPLAEAECAQLDERVGFLREQVRDLERSSRELDDLIAELTRRIDDDFGETLTTVAEQFGKMCAILFPGGRGRLLPVAGEGDEPAGVGIEVKPARKLGKRLGLLSGGERALVAIAFLMALMLARPSPFYVLDEIEAALDDVNIGRFVSLLREYRQHTQFIIITHQKRTMEAADVLYGVTMGPDGGSHVVSARMAEREIDAEEVSVQASAKAASARRDEPRRSAPAAVAMVDLEDAAGDVGDDPDDVGGDSDDALDGSEDAVADVEPDEVT